MSKTDDKIQNYTQNAKDLGLNIDSELLAKVTKGLGPSIHNKDAETVSCSDASELDRVRENFLKKKLGLTNPDDELDASIKEVCQEMGTSNRNKYRAIFYTLLVNKFNKESIYA